MRLARYAFLAMALMSGCKSKDAGQGGPSPAALDPSCSRHTPQDCGKAGPNCAVNGTECAGTATYCATFIAATCPTISCLWTSGNTPSCIPRGMSSTSGVAPKCSANTGNTACSGVAGCSWTGNACVSTSNPPQCGAYTPEFCKIAGCQEANSLCVATSQSGTLPGALPGLSVAQCAVYNQPVACNGTQGCQWTLTEGCKPSPASSQNCAMNSTQPLCSAQQGCAWNNAGGGCQPVINSNTPQSTACSNFSGNASTCDSTQGCQWMNNNCIASLCRGAAVLKCMSLQSCQYIPFSGCFPK
jgi:hypothetical protein